MSLISTFQHGLMRFSCHAIVYLHAPLSISETKQKNLLFFFCSAPKRILHTHTHTHPQIIINIHSTIHLSSSKRAKKKRQTKLKSSTFDSERILTFVT